MADVVKQVLGPVSAYALAKQQGYGGTLEEWAQDQANAGANAAAAKKSAEDAAAILEQIKENNKSYAEEINKLKALTAADVGARPDNWMPTAEQVGARPDNWMPSAKDVGALPENGTAADSEKLGGNNAAEYLLKANAYQMDLLYTNPSPTSEFAGQILSSFDLTEYTHVLIEYMYATTLQWRLSQIVETAGVFVVSVCMTKNYYRDGYITGDGKGIGFQSAKTYNTYGGTAEDLNDMLIPYKIYGIKGVDA